MRLIVSFILALGPLLGAEYAIHTREGGIAYYGTTRIYVGPYTWPEGKAPTSVYNSGALNLESRYDHPSVVCDPATDTCTAQGQNLPDGTEVKFGTTGELPAPLVPWEKDNSKAYYIRDSTPDTFRLAESVGGSAIDITNAGSGTHGMSFAGYSHVMTIMARFVHRMTCDPDTDICTTDEPHKYKDGAGLSLLNENGLLPSPLLAFFASRPAVYCAVVVDEQRFQLRLTNGDTSCPVIPYNENTTTVTCTEGRSFCTYSSPIALSNGVRVRLRSTEKLPEPLDPSTAYVITGLNKAAQTFRLMSDIDGVNITLNTSGSGTITAEAVVEDITDRGTGTQYSSFSSGSNLYIDDIQGYPPGTTFSFRATDTAASGVTLSTRRYGSIVGSYGLGTFIAKVPSVTPAGDYPITVTLTDSNRVTQNPKSMTYVLQAMQLEPLPKRDPSWSPPIPNLALWERTMTSSTDGGGGATGPVYPRCPDRVNPAAGMGDVGFPGVDGKIWFYDGAANFLEVSAYPRIADRVPDQPLWANCGEYIAGSLRDAYLKQPAQHGWNYFPRGLYLAYEHTKDERYKDAIVAIADRGNFSRGINREFGMREHAYAFERRIYRYYATGENDEALPYFADIAIGMLLPHIYGDPSRLFMQPFMAGLLARPLTEYYQISHDERIPVVIKLLADKFWSDWYDSSTHKMLYNSEPYGTRCTVGCAKFTGANLNNLVSPIFAFVWRLTGDDVYRARGDDLFGNVFHDGMPWDAKQWNQVYYWGWDYVRWRQGDPILTPARKRAR